MSWTLLICPSTCLETLIIRSKVNLLKKERRRWETTWSFWGCLPSAPLYWLYFNLSHWGLSPLRSAGLSEQSSSQDPGFDVVGNETWLQDTREERPHHHWRRLRGCRGTAFQHALLLRVATFHKKEERGREMVRKSVWVYLLGSRWCKLAADTVFVDRDVDQLRHQKDWLFFHTLWSPSFSVFIPLVFS